MTEPDEATLWARERAKERLDHSARRELARQNISAEIDAGKHDDELSDEAQAYRAGQAASAERIKALEEALKDSVTAMQLTLDAVERHNTESTTFLSGFPLHLMSRRIAEAHALLKETDQ